MNAADRNRNFFFKSFSITNSANFDEILTDHHGGKANRNNYAGQWYPHILKGSRQSHSFDDPIAAEQRFSMECN